MGHYLEENEDGTTSFAYNAEAGDPWHRLGNPVDGTQPLDVMLKTANADYEVTMEPIQAVMADPNGGDPHLVSDESHRATCRINPKTGERQVLGIVGAGYVPVQNREVTERALAVVNADGNDAVIDTMGVLFDGRRFFASIDLGSLFIDPQGINDEVKKYVGVYTGHDGSMAVTYFNDNMRVVCYNTVTAAVAGAKKAGAKRYLSARHTTNVKTIIEDGLKAFGAAQAWQEAFDRTANALLAAPGGRDVLQGAIDLVVPLPDKAEVSTRSYNSAVERRETIQALYTRPTNAGGFGDSGWTVFNTIGEYLDHARKGKAADKAVASMTPGSWVDAMKREVAGFLLQDA